MNGNGASVVSRLEQLSMLQLFVDQIRLNRVALRGYLSSYGNADENDHWRLQELLDLIGVPAIIPEQGSELTMAST
ncbi:hypothetical protein TNCT_278481 [Trichonephila clavata]|uniref:Uncharacterized protein n=1 Tax=Trichonephila clavata TaxID=2740835 RepID=A0A8X6HHF7_TRICU|nr:hypothetical protein TNCT_706441 [Trichonephila clavata]GFR23699.1 hypothetical protein TNCT_278481 [Trichonephila clavata]